MQIYATGNYCEPVTTTLPVLKELVKAASGKAVRRVDRFIQLALIGVGRSVGAQSIAADTAVYMAAPRGDLEVTQEIVEQLFRQGLAPKPLSFINSVSNAACFYIAQNFALQGRSNFICNRYFAFESALQLALADFAAGLFNSALIGVVDVAVEPLRGHRERARVPVDSPLVEASHWVWVGAGNADGARIIAAQHFSSREALQHWLRQQALPIDSTYFCAGQFIAAADAQALRRECGFENQFECASAGGLYDCRSGAAIAAFQQIHGGKQKYLLHVNADPSGRYSAFLIAS